MFMKTKFLTILLVILAIFVVSCPSGPEVPPSPTPDAPVIPEDPVKPTEDVDTEDVSTEYTNAWKTVLTSLVKNASTASEEGKVSVQNEMNRLTEDKTVDIPSKLGVSGAETIRVKYNKGSFQNPKGDTNKCSLSGEYVADKKSFKVEGEIKNVSDGMEQKMEGSLIYYEGNTSHSLNLDVLAEGPEEGSYEYKAMVLIEGTSGREGRTIFDEVSVETVTTYTNYSDNKINGKATNTTVNSKTKYYVSNDNIELTINEVKLTVRYNIKTTVGEEETAENGSYLQVKKEGDEKFKNFKLTELGFKEASVSPEA